MKLASKITYIIFLSFKILLDNIIFLIKNYNFFFFSKFILITSYFIILFI